VRISTEPELAKARDLVHRLDTRKIYSSVGEKGLSPEKAAQIKQITEEDIINHASDSGDLRAEDIVVRKFSVNMGMKDKNPMSCVSFYRNSEEGYQRIKKELDEMSTMMPEKCESHCVRLFVKDETKFELASNAFKQFCKERLGGKPFQTREISHSQSQQVVQSLS